MHHDTSELKLDVKWRAFAGHFVSLIITLDPYVVLKILRIIWNPSLRGFPQLPTESRNGSLNVWTLLHTTYQLSEWNMQNWYLTLRHQLIRNTAFSIL